VLIVSPGIDLGSSLRDPFAPHLSQRRSAAIAYRGMKLLLEGPAVVRGRA
jgi:hypothetical protein